MLNVTSHDMLLTN